MNKFKFFFLLFFVGIFSFSQNSYTIKVEYNPPIDNISTPENTDLLIYNDPDGAGPLANQLWVTIDQADVSKSVETANNKIVVSGFNQFVPGTTYNLTFSFRDEAGNISNPAAAISHTEPGGGSSTTPPAFKAASSGVTYTSTTSGSANYPATVDNNDFLVAVFYRDGTATPVNTPTGWSPIGAYSSNGGTDISWAAYYKIADGTESGSIPFEWNASSGTQTKGVMYSYSGASGIENYHANSIEQSIGQVYNNPNTPNGSNRLAVGIYIQRDNAPVVANLTGYTQNSLLVNASGADMTFATCSEVLATSSTDDGTMQFDTSGIAATWNLSFGFFLIPSN